MLLTGLGTISVRKGLFQFSIYIVIVHVCNKLLKGARPFFGRLMSAVSELVIKILAITLIDNAFVSADI